METRLSTFLRGGTKLKGQSAHAEGHFPFFLNLFKKKQKKNLSHSSALLSFFQLQVFLSFYFIIIISTL